MDEKDLCAVIRQILITIDSYFNTMKAIRHEKVSLLVIVKQIES